MRFNGWGKLYNSQRKLYFSSNCYCVANKITLTILLSHMGSKMSPYSSFTAGRILQECTEMKTQYGRTQRIMHRIHIQNYSSVNLFSKFSSHLSVQFEPLFAIMCSELYTSRFPHRLGDWTSVQKWLAMSPLPNSLDISQPEKNLEQNRYNFIFMILGKLELNCW